MSKNVHLYVLLKIVNVKEKRTHHYVVFHNATIILSLIIADQFVLTLIGINEQCVRMHYYVLIFKPGQYL